MNTNTGKWLSWNQWLHCPPPILGSSGVCKLAALSGTCRDNIAGLQAVTGDHFYGQAWIMVWPNHGQACAVFSTDKVGPRPECDCWLAKQLPVRLSQSIYTVGFTSNLIHTTTPISATHKALLVTRQRLFPHTNLDSRCWSLIQLIGIHNLTDIS